MIPMVTDKTIEALQVASNVLNTVVYIPIVSDDIIERNKKDISDSKTDWKLNGIMMECPDCHCFVAWVSPYCPICGKPRKKDAESEVSDGQKQ